MTVYTPNRTHPGLVIAWDDFELANDPNCSGNAYWDYHHTLAGIADCQAVVEITPARDSAQAGSFCADALGDGKAAGACEWVPLTACVDFVGYEASLGNGVRCGVDAAGGVVLKFAGRAVCRAGACARIVAGMDNVASSSAFKWFRNSKLGNKLFGGGLSPNGALDDLGRLSCRSFSGDTEVLMANGTTKPIREIEAGDLVVAVDPESGAIAPQAVRRTLPHVDELLVFETTAGIIWTTEDHLYWNTTDGEWQESQELAPGDALLSATGAPVLTIGLDWQSRRVDMAYDLDVGGFDTFFVVLGDESALVHNIECPWQLKTDPNFSNQVLDGPLPQTGQLSDLTRGQLQDLQSDLATSITNRQQNLWDGTFPTGTESFRSHAARVDQEIGLLDRVDDLLG